MKDAIRKEFLAKRNALSAEGVKNKSASVIKNLKSYPDYQKAKVVLYYVSKGNEVATHDLIKSAFKDKTVVVPKAINNQVICCVIKDFFEPTP